jgi:hypothetical protein
MWRGWVVGVVALCGCGRTGIFSPDPGGAPGGEGGSAGAGSAASAGGSDATSATGGSGGSGTGGETADPVCTATCCDGSTVQWSAAGQGTCTIDNAMGCADKGGPLHVTYGEVTVWQGDGACPSMRPCRVNCCNGEKVKLQDQYDGDMCAELGENTAECAGKGGVARALFDGAKVFEDMSCDGNCLASCCDGSVAFIDQPWQLDCEVWAGRMCTATEDGPTGVGYSGVLVWTASGQCPSLKLCTLTCVDGAVEVSDRYQAKVCMVESLASAYCVVHGGPEVISFDGQSVWKLP